EQARRGRAQEVRIFEPSQVREGTKKERGDFFGLRLGGRPEPGRAHRDSKNEGGSSECGNGAQGRRVLVGARQGRPRKRARKGGVEGYGQAHDVWAGRVMGGCNGGRG